MNYLKDKTVYLAGSIHHNDEDSGVGWRELITPKLESMTINVLDPCKKTINGVGEIGDDKQELKKLIKEKKFLEVKNKFFPILKADLRCVDLSHFIIINYRPKIRHVGTIHELVMANIEKKPILLYYPPNELEDFNPWLACLVKAEHIFDDWDNMFSYLRIVNAGKFDTSLWY
jgi:hypothetical protein